MPGKSCLLGKIQQERFHHSLVPQQGTGGPSWVRYGKSTRRYYWPSKMLFIVHFLYLGTQKVDFQPRNLYWKWYNTDENSRTS
jgi:hypothetical protein